ASARQPASSLNSRPPGGRGDGLPGTLRTQGRFMTPEFIYTMKDLRKVVPPKREILKGIWLSFFFGAKIGVLGLNGAGKSSLLRIMAGEDGEFMGEAVPAQGIKVGFLSQEPRPDPQKTVLGKLGEGA